MVSSSQKIKQPRVPHSAPTITPETIMAAKSKLLAIQPGDTARVSPTTQLLRELMPEIKQARAMGASWKTISELINGVCNTTIHPAALRAASGEPKKSTSNAATN